MSTFVDLVLLQEALLQEEEVWNSMNRPDAFMRHTHARPSVLLQCAAKNSRQSYIYLYFCRYSFET